MKNKTSKAAFSLSDFKFTKVMLNYESINKDCKISVTFNPSGIYTSKSKTFKLTLEFLAIDESSDKKNPFISINLVSFFIFENVKKIEDIPDFFYSNCIAIIYPYVRAFVSNITLQANISPFLLPTLNLSSLQDTLRQNTISN